MGTHKRRTLKVQVAGTAKMRTVRLRFAKTSTWVLDFANPRVGGWLGLPK